MAQATRQLQTIPAAETDRRARILDTLYDSLASYARTQHHATFLPRLATTYAKLVTSDGRAESSRRDAVRDVLLTMVESHGEELMAVESLAEAMHLITNPLTVAR